jgi:hypothetical protein
MPVPRPAKAVKSTRCKKATGQASSGKTKATKGARNTVPALDFLVSPLPRNMDPVDLHQDKIVIHPSDTMRLEKESASAATTKTEVKQTTETTDDKTPLENSSEHWPCGDEPLLDMVEVLPVAAPDTETVS